MKVVDEILALFGARGAEAYFGESVSVTEHCLQTAHWAQHVAAPPALIVAALLHDIGHLVVAAPTDLADWVDDAHHEETGARWLAQRFPLAVAEPVRLHVPAKRYLCATDPGYRAKLSPASVVTLELQGGPMSATESAAFERQPCFREALRLRLWDDQAKVPGLVTPSVADHAALIERLAIASP